ncbi:hypothetical protein QUT87_22445, partial [Xanthomonas citri pv. citri]
VPERLTILCVMGGANLDLRQASFAAREVVITVNAFMGGASIIVGPHTQVVLEGVGIMGGYSGPSGLVDAVLDDSSPSVRVKGVAVWGGVSVERKQMPGPGQAARRGWTGHRPVGSGTGQALPSAAAVCSSAMWLSSATR